MAFKRAFRRTVRYCAAASIFGLTVMAFPAAKANAAAWSFNLRMRDVKSAHVTTYMLANGTTPHKSSDLYYQDGQWRIDRGDTIQCYAGGETVSFQPKQNLLLKTRKPLFYHSPSGFSTKSIIGDFGILDTNLRVEHDTVISGGWHLDKMTLIENKRQTRDIIFSDPETGLPVSADMEMRKADGWTPVMHADFELNRPMDPSTFQPRTNASTRIIDIDSDGPKLFGEYAKNPAARIKLKHDELTIYRVDVNRNGDMFVLMTAKSLATFGIETHEMELQDASGRRCIQTQIMMGANWMDGHQEGRFIEGRPSYLIILSPVDDLGFKPSKLRLMAQASDGNHFGGSRSFKATPSGELRPMELTGLIPVWSGAVDKPTCEVLPEYAPFTWERISGGQGLAQRLEEMKSRDCAQRGDWSEAAMYGERFIRDTDLLEEQGEGPWARHQAYFRLYEAYRNLGDHDKALHYLKLAAGSPLEFPEPEFQRKLAEAEASEAKP